MSQELLQYHLETIKSEKFHGGTSEMSKEKNNKKIMISRGEMRNSLYPQEG